MTTIFVQRYLAKDEWGPSVAKGLVMGIIAGVPFQVTGTAVGMPSCWPGLGQHSGSNCRWPKSKPDNFLRSDEIVDVEVKDVK